MAIVEKVSSRELFMGKLQFGRDLLEELTGICIDNSIALGRIEALGAVQKARLAYYDQGQQEYRFFTIDRHLEITSLIGNVSLKDNKPIVHAHVSLADEAGNGYGGHLASGTVIFACECVVEVFDGPVFKRAKDAQTGLPLWKMV